MKMPKLLYDTILRSRNLEKIGPEFCSIEDHPVQNCFRINIDGNKGMHFEWKLISESIELKNVRIELIESFCLRIEFPIEKPKFFQIFRTNITENLSV